MCLLLPAPHNMCSCVAQRTSPLHTFCYEELYRTLAVVRHIFVATFFPLFSPFFLFTLRRIHSQFDDELLEKKMFFFSALFRVRNKSYAQNDDRDVEIGLDSSLKEFMTLKRLVTDRDEQNIQFYCILYDKCTFMYREIDQDDSLQTTDK